MFGAFMALLMTSCYNGNSNENATSSPSFDEVLTSRRSVRNYDASKKITEAEVRDLIKATQEAPSWANQQPTKYYVAIPENETIMAVIALGYRAEEPNRPERKNLDEMVKFF